MLQRDWDPGLLNLMRGWVRTQELYAWEQQRNHGVALTSQRDTAQPIQGLRTTLATRLCPPSS